MIVATSLDKAFSGITYLLCFISARSFFSLMTEKLWPYTQAVDLHPPSSSSQTDVAWKA